MKKNSPAFQSPNCASIETAIPQPLLSGNIFEEDEYIVMSSASVDIKHPLPSCKSVKKSSPAFQSPNCASIETESHHSTGLHMENVLPSLYVPNPLYGTAQNADNIDYLSTLNPKQVSVIQCF